MNRTQKLGWLENTSNWLDSISGRISMLTIIVFELVIIAILLPDALTRAMSPATFAVTGPFVIAGLSGIILAAVTWWGFRENRKQARHQREQALLDAEKEKLKADEIHIVFTMSEILLLAREVHITQQCTLPAFDEWPAPLKVICGIC